MYRKIFVLGLIGAALLAACGTQAGQQPEAVAGEETSGEGMMEETEPMSGEETMDEGESGQEMMDETEPMSGEEAMDDEMMGDVTFVVRIENVASQDNVLLAPGAWAVHTEDGVMFVSGEPDRGDGLEALAEDGDPDGLVTSLKGYMGVEASEAFNTPAGASQAGPLAPGSAYEFTVTAHDGAKLSFATMFVQSNDLFYAPDESGIALFDADGHPIDGDLTGLISLWDAGTEVNEEPFAGPNQAPRQSGPNIGPDENGVVQPVSDDFTYPPLADVLKVTITAEGM